ncbi:FxLYD domain-containing protein [Brevibacillus dissolubilis]|uniref:FxLYD domain-containing protein n=1 Tax=Brevibacillus dissolubilis TaxID=1844116 RepID=UPI001115EE8B|nr:FxLYD domain-containing protein [Brevibacillus dissolubilis]
MIFLSKSKLIALSIVALAATSSVLAYAAQDTQEANGDKAQKLKVKLPKQPEVWELYPTLDKEMYKPDFVDNSGLMGGSIPEDTGPGHMLTDNTMVNFLGFQGAYYASEVTGEGVQVIENSLNIAESGDWKALGLVRNETTEVVGQIKVEAVLHGADGSILETVKDKIEVESIRPGEPAPFELKANTPVEQVASIDWNITTDEVKQQAARDLHLKVYYELGFGKPDYKGQKREDAPYPYVMSASVNTLDRAIKQAELTAAWIDENGKVLWIEQAKLDPMFRNGMVEYSAAYFQDIVVTDPTVGPKLNQVPYLLWVVGRQ